MGTVVQTEIKRILGLSVPVSVTLAEREMALEEVLQVNVGTIIEFDVPFDTELTLCAAKHPIGRGLAVNVGEKFGLRLTRVLSVRDRVGAMGPS